MIEGNEGDSGGRIACEVEGQGGGEGARGGRQRVGREAASCMRVSRGEPVRRKDA